MGRKMKKLLKKAKVKILPTSLALKLLLFLDPEEWNTPFVRWQLESLKGPDGKKAFPTPLLDKVVLKKGERVINSKRWSKKSLKHLEVENLLEEKIALERGGERRTWRP